MSELAIKRLAARAPWGFAALPVVAVVVGLRWGPGPGVLVATAGALAAALVLLHRSFGALLEGRSAGPLDVELDSGEVALETEKSAVLRALKDIEYERAVGKLSDEDFEVLSKQYRSRAVRILADIDRDLSPFTKKAEAAIARRLQREVVPSAARKAEPEAPAEEARCRHCGASIDGETVFCRKCGKHVEEVVCGGCGAALDADSIFCKRCGKKLTHDA